MLSPSGLRVFVWFGIGLLSIGATQRGGFDALKTAWDICESKATEHGKPMDHARSRLVRTMHTGATEEQAARDAEFGLPDRVGYQHASPRSLRPTPATPASWSTPGPVSPSSAPEMAVLSPAFRAVRWLRRLPAHGARLGGSRAHAALIQALRAR
jgi:limonene 1,2-monooxygenase